MALIKCPECGKEISDKAQSCPNCGCPISVETVQPIVEEAITESTENVVEPIEPMVQQPIPKKNNKLKIIIPIVAVVIVLALVLYFPVLKSVADKSASKGDYDKAISLLKLNPVYSGRTQDLTYESYAMEGFESYKELLKNPDSLTVRKLYVYDGDVKTISDEKFAEKVKNVTDGMPIFFAETMAQNGFGGNTGNIVILAYNSETNKYEYMGYTNTYSVLELDRSDPNYEYYRTATNFISSYKEYGKIIKKLDVSGINEVLKNQSYTVVKVAN